MSSTNPGLPCLDDLSLQEDSPSQSVFVISDEEHLERGKSEIIGQSCLALDCEGIHLGREGQLSIVQIATTNCCFIFDVLKENSSSEMILFLKSILEDESVVKIIHDCRADSDALHHILGIDLNGVHDTQAWQMTLLPAKGRLNLNDTLTTFGCPINPARHSTVYKTNPSFWATRPLTKDMIEWASEDVNTLFLLCERQAARADAEAAARCAAASRQHLDEFRACLVQVARVHPTQIGRFIGKGGANIRDLERATGATFHAMDAGAFAVYAGGAAALDKAAAAVRAYAAPYVQRPRAGDWH
jgi:hypothetical protein